MRDTDAAMRRVVTVPVLRGSFVVVRDLAPRHRTGLDGIVPEGMRAIRVTVTGALRPRTGRGGRRARELRRRARPTPRAPLATTVVVAAGVRVLGTDTRASGGTGRTDALAVTLLVDRDEAERLADAQVNGVLTLALVPPEEAASTSSVRSWRPVASMVSLPTLHAIILGIVQGLSEFLPISSSGHLLLVPDLLGWNDFGGNDSLEKSFDVALHLGTLIAALWYFRHDLLVYVRAALHSIRVRAVDTTDARLAWLLLLSAIPGAIIGAAFESTIEEELGDPILIGVNLIVFALLLEWADQAAAKRDTTTSTVVTRASWVSRRPSRSRRECRDRA